MKKETFNKLWNASFEFWMENADTQKSCDDEKVAVKSLCCFSKSAKEDVFTSYNHIKRIAKDIYFKNKSDSGEFVHLNRYKRAAVLTYAVITANPLELTYDEGNHLLDIYFLKQRLAFFVGLQSIVQDFPQEQVKEKIKQTGAVFSLEKLGSNELLAGEDDFEMSIYKDLLFAELHHNYNILTMANVYGLLTEKASILCDISPVNHISIQN